jgi:alkaline phosphatase D
MVSRLNQSMVALAVVSVALGVFAFNADAQEVFPYSVASGDPRADGVVLWTNVDGDVTVDALRVEVATDDGFTNIVVTRDGLAADEAFDHCVKVRVDGLEPSTTYYYRFVATVDSGDVMSSVGRTRTAGSPGDPRPLKVAVIYCQDYVGRWFNSIAKLLRDHDDDIDVVIYLGDYVYETTGDPSFQDPGGERQVVFEDVEGAIPLGPETLAAKSLANYRTLYRTYRSDPMLQELHERWPVVAIWDDHEFSDDSWGSNGTYFDGLVDEEDTQRKRDAERVYYEWMPIEPGLGADGLFRIDNSNLYPNTGIYRAFRFGQHLDLVMTDYRTYRPDHLIPEDAFPGAIALDEATLEMLLGEAWPAIRETFDPYIDFDTVGQAFPIFRQTVSLILANGYMAAAPGLEFSGALGLAESQLEGDISVTFINELFAAAGLEPVLDAETADAFGGYGLSYLYLGKTGFYTSTGSRYAVIHDAYQLLAAARWLETGGAAQDAFGPQQTGWIFGQLLASTASWRILGNSVMMTPLLVDFTHPAIAGQLPPEFPDQLRTRLGLNVDHFDGFPQKRLEVLGALAMAPNSLVVSGDIHGTFVTDHGNGIFELTPPAVSSGTFQELVERTVANDPILGQIPGLDPLLAQLPLLLQVSTQDDAVVPSDILYAQTDLHGYMVLEIDGEEVVARMMEISADVAFTSYYDTPEALDALFTETAFRISGGQLMPMP